MIKNWSSVFARFSKFNFTFLTRGRFWTHAVRLLARCAPKGMAEMREGGANYAIVLSASPLVSRSLSLPGQPSPPDFSFPLALYQEAMDSGVAAKAIWAHRCKAAPLGQEGVEILVLRIPRKPLTQR